MMEPAELMALGGDVDTHGMTAPIILLHQKAEPELSMLDGRNRLDGMELVGLDVPALLRAALDGKPEPQLSVRYVAAEEVDPYDYVISANVTPGAVYKGLVFGTNVNGVFLFATNFRAGTIDVFAPNQDPVTHIGLNFKSATTSGGFVDPKIPAGSAPFGIENIVGDLFVSYALQKTEKHDDVAGPGHGFVDVFDTDGHLLRRFATRGPLQGSRPCQTRAAILSSDNLRALVSGRYRCKDPAFGIPAVNREVGRKADLSA
jgi:hypothetical protein